MSGEERRRLVLVSCRHCLRPVTLAGAIDDRERAALRAHLRGCAVRLPVDQGPNADEVLRHFRIVGDF